MRTLSQTFTFPGASHVELADVLATAPLIGDGSIFGRRTASSTRSEGDSRHVHGFQPVPGPVAILVFDVALRQERSDHRTAVTVEFTQPDRRRPYLAGKFVWLLGATPDGSGAVLQEEINTPTALDIVDTPLHGSTPSLRRWLFFAGGHQRLMKEAMDNVRALLGQ